MEDFIIKIILRTLETVSTMQQRWMSLQIIYNICKNPQTLLDIFINYDCDLEMKDLFERYRGGDSGGRDCSFYKIEL